MQPASRSKGSLAQGLLQVGIFWSAGAVPKALGAPRCPGRFPRIHAGLRGGWLRGEVLLQVFGHWMNPPGSLASREARGREWGGHVVCRSRGGASRAALPGVEARRPAALRLRCASSGARWGQIVPGAFPALGGLSILLCAGVGGEPAECCELRFGAGWGLAPLMIPRWPWSWEALFALGGSGWVAGSWGGQGKPQGLALPGELAHLPFPWGIVRGALGALLPPPGALGSGGGGPAELGRAFVRRPLLGRSRLRGSVFRPFS